MKKQENYPMKTYLIKVYSNSKRKIQAQASIELSLALVIAVLFLILSCNIFVWLNHNIVQRQRAYENSRIEAASSPERAGNPGKLDFYTPDKLNVFSSGGR